ncbi:phosphatase [Aureococcus anophagefferens]|nr:phosphatase [Aureococcus anophagefferens]
MRFTFAKWSSSASLLQGAFRSLRTRPKRASSANAGDDDEPSDADYPYVWALRKTSILDWEKDVPDADAWRAEVKRMFALPVDVVPGEVYLGDAVCARDVARLQSLRITHVLNAAGAAAPPPRPTRRWHRDARARGARRARYPMLANHLDAARAFLAKARRSGGAVLVHCAQGLNCPAPSLPRTSCSRSGARCSTRQALPRARGNECVSNKTFQRDLVDLARATCSAAGALAAPLRAGAAAGGARRGAAAPAGALAPPVDVALGRLMRASSRAG